MRSFKNNILCSVWFYFVQWNCTRMLWYKETAYFTVTVTTALKKAKEKFTNKANKWKKAEKHKKTRPQFMPKFLPFKKFLQSFDGIILDN
jgi:hypothetical protein